MPIGLGIALLVADSPAQAYELYSDEDTTVIGNFLAVYGLFNSRKNYDGSTGGSSWREDFIKYGLSIDQTLGNLGSFYGTANPGIHRRAWHPGAGLYPWHRCR
ncbi:hypothetical protein SAMN03159306_00034 [Pseudomonas sp. NFACC48-1]|nr:hypothetical protein SAMN03159405_00034 [Pseudomonas sp. NFACC44-2]SDA81628.1 hypothetical protein SAMN03159429_04321 [Pseudomonas sp. NFACC51]SDW62607.1 hypothetical protein SAMN03159474_01381 [Pseudomonas sp. NFACC08-1]SEI39484.1 hypothetical protein SAMN03159298_00034 [Pseudomonas sp. NFACC07-1]SFG97882.1 hypothetical protein SAMN03159302_00034 [Pseudomonas sp. NFACC54]SFS34287.1 hypothetical protein SAMN03159306_00034 [Pseudomonas sp. NFACC48-1]